MKKIGYEERIPFEKIGIGKWEFCKFPGGRIVVYQIIDGQDDEIIGEYEDEKDFLKNAVNLGFHRLDLSFICRFLS